MKKYLILSLFIHSSALLPLIWVSSDPALSNRVSKTLHFEILSLQEGDESHSPTQRQRTQAKIASNQKAKVLAQKVENPLPEVSEKPTAISKFEQSPMKTENPSQVIHNSQSSEGVPNASEEARRQRLDYAQQLKLFIEQNKFYPRSARKLKQTGLVRLQVEIDTNGNFRNIQIIEASHHDNLNQAALSLIQKLGRFKPLPKEFISDTDFTIPIAYQLSGG